MSKKSRYLPTPEYKEIRSGCKVCWRYFETEDEAKAASKIAKHNADLQWDAGYDFGYQCPGAITKMKDDLQGEWANTTGCGKSVSRNQPRGFGPCFQIP